MNIGEINNPLRDKVLFVKDRLPGAIVFFFLFASVSVLISLFIGYFWRNSYFIFGVALLISAHLYKNERFNFEIPIKVYALASLMFLLFLSSLILYTPFYPGSADAVGTTIIRVLGDRIPDTYAPYANVKLTYQIGFHLFAKIFVDMLSFIPDYLVLWFFAALLASLQVILIYLFGAAFFKSRAHGELMAILLFGTKTVFQFTFWGMAPMLLALDLFMLFFVMFIEGSRLKYLFFPSVFAVHPFGWLVTVFVTSFYTIFNRQYLKSFLKVVPSILLVIPFVLKTYFTYAANVVEADVFPYAVSLSLGEAGKLLVLLVTWFGVVPSIFLALSFLSGADMSKEKNKLVLSLFSLSLFTYVVMYFLGWIFGDKFFIPVTISGLLLAATVLKKSRSNALLRNDVQLLVVFLCISANLNSGEIMYLMKGSKVSGDGVELAQKLYQFDPSLESTLFLSPGGGWMGHISNKLPFDPTSGHLIPAYAAHAVRDEGWLEVVERKKKQKEIYETKCIECIYKLNITYAVINKNYFNVTLKEKPVLQYKYFDVYKLK